MDSQRRGRGSSVLAVHDAAARTRLASLLCAVCAVCAPQARAQELPEDADGETRSVESGPSERDDAEPASPAARVRFRYVLATDLSLTIGATAVGFASTLVSDELAAPPIGDPDDVFVLDRGVARRVLTRDAARHASDVVLFATVGLGAVASALSVGDFDPSDRRERRRERARRFAIFFESLATTNAVTTIVKVGVRRPRPLTYASDYDPAEGRFDDGLSYFSGHTSTVAAASATATYFAFIEHPGSARAYGTLGAGLLATSAVGFLRVRAGKHFPTDVLTGAAVGASVGVLVPHLHRHGRVAIHLETSANGASLALAGLL